MNRASLVVVLPLVSVLALTACNGALPPTVPTGDGAPVIGSVFSVGYDRIAEVYLKPLDLGDLTVDGLAGLKDIDGQLGARRAGSAIQLVSGGSTVGSFPAPAPDDAEGWARLTMAALARGRKVSPALHDATAEEIYDAVFSAIAADLDPYSRYVGAEQAIDERAFRDGYGGIGLLLDQDEAGRPLVREVFDEGPAFRAGMEAGSVIVAVDGRSVAEMEIEELGDLLRGPAGTFVRLTVEPPGGGEASFSLRRERVIVDAVELRLDGDIAIIEVSRFNSATAADAAEAIRTAMDRLDGEVEGMILDLRGNPGGLLGESVEVADLFLAGGPIITTRGRHPDSFQYFDADGEDLGHGLPLVVLIDGHSASGAEVVAAALQDRGRAVVVGATSYGKGSVQTVTRLPNGGELFLTWSRIYSPEGYTLHEVGVMPTVCTSDAGNAAALLARFESGALQVPAGMIDARRAAAEDDAALEHLRSICPWQEEHDESLDLQVAEMLLRDDTLFAHALGAVAHPVVASADRLDSAH